MGRKAFLLRSISALPMILAPVVALFASGCVSSQLVETTQAYYDAGPEASLEVLSNTEEIRPEDRLLASMEKAMSLQELGRYEESNKVLDQIVAELSTGKGPADTLAGIFASDEAGTYRGEYFEQVYLQTLKIANSLALQDLDGAAKAADGALATVGQLQCHRCRFPFTRYLAALTYEHQGRLGRAEDVLLEALVESPHLQLLNSELERISLVAERAPVGFAPPPVERSPERELVVLLLLGRGPQKVESGVAIPANSAVTWPVYEARIPQVVVGADVRVPLHGTFRSVLMTDMLSLARDSLVDRIASVVAKEIARTTVQEAVSIEVGESFGAGVEMLLRSMFVAADRADLRHWSSLPASCQVIRLTLPDGVSRLQLRYLSLTGEVVDRELLQLPREWTDGPLFITRRMP